MLPTPSGVYVSVGQATIVETDEFPPQQESIE